MKRLLLLIFTFFIVFESYPQNIHEIRMPAPVFTKEGDTVRIYTSKTKTIFLYEKEDTLWVFKGSQFKKALQIAKELEYTKEEVVELKFINSKKDQEVIKLEEKNEILVKDRDFYRDKYTETDKMLTETRRRVRRQSIYKTIAMVGVPVAFVFGIIMSK